MSGAPQRSDIFTEVFASIETRLSRLEASIRLLNAAVAAGGGGGGGGGASAATTSLLGIVRLSHASSSPASPVVVETADARMSDARTPTAHTHPESDITGLVSDLAGKAAVTHTHAESDITGLVSDLAGKAATVHTHALSALLQSGASDYQVVRWDAGSSAYVPRLLDENSFLSANKDGTAATPSLRTLGTGSTQAAAGNDSRLSNARTPTGHHATHEPGGSDAMTVDDVAATGSLRTLGTGSQQAAAGNDSRLSNARTPTAHASSHATGGSDALTPANIGAATVADPLGWGYPRTWLGQAPTTVGNVGAVNGARWMRWIGGATIVKIRLWIGTSSGNIDVGVYSSTGVGSAAAPGARKASTGSIASPGTSGQDITLAVVVNNGDWIALAADNTTFTHAQISLGAGNAMGLAECFSSTSSFPLPSTAPTLSASSTGIAAIGLTS